MPNAKMTTIRKYILTILILTTWSKFTTGQNLVPNPSFDSVSNCFPFLDQLNCLSWFSPTDGTSDNFHTCFNSNQPMLGVPQNMVGYQFPHSGLGYAGAEFFIDGNNYREYIETKLNSPLQAGKKYCVSLYVSLADVSGCAISNIQLYFSNDTLLDTTANYPIINVTPQVSETVIISDTMNWTLISAEYYAVGGEQFLTLGNFMTSSTTNYIPTTGGSTPMAYYYIDDISIIYCDVIGVSEEQTASFFRIYPNPTSQSTTLEFNNVTRQNCNLTVYDLRGQIVKTIKNITSDRVTIERQDLANGLYFIKLWTDRENIATGKLTIE